MKKQWDTFRNYFIQFLIVVLGVFVTLISASITDRVRENKKTRQALVMIYNELDKYYTALSEKEGFYRAELSMYNGIMNYVGGQESIPSPDTLRLSRSLYAVIRFEQAIHVSLESAEKSGALNNIKDLSLLESIYDSYEYVSFVYRTNNEKTEYKLDKFNSGITPELAPYFSNNSSSDPEQLARFWDELTSNQHFFCTVINGQTKMGLVLSGVQQGKMSIAETLNQIDDYIGRPKSNRGIKE